MTFDEAIAKAVENAVKAEDNVARGQASASAGRIEIANFYLRLAKLQSSGQEFTL